MNKERRGKGWEEVEFHEKDRDVNTFLPDCVVCSPVYTCILKLNEPKIVTTPINLMWMRRVMI